MECPLCESGTHCPVHDGPHEHSDQLPMRKYDDLEVRVEMQKLPCTLSFVFGDKPTDDEIALVGLYCRNVLMMDVERTSVDSVGAWPVKWAVTVNGKMSPVFDTGPLRSSIRYVLNTGALHDHGPHGSYRH